MPKAISSSITQPDRAHNPAQSIVSFITAEAIAMNRLAGETARLVERLEILGMATENGLRPAVENAAEALIGFLDYLDGDPDLEPEEDDDPSDFEDADDNGIADAGGLAEQWTGFGHVTSGVE